MKSALVLCLASAMLLAGCAKSIAGKYRIEQDAGALGSGAEHGQLDLRKDGSFSIEIGPVVLAKGGWKQNGDSIELSKGPANMGTSYRISEGKLIPVVNGKDVTFWRFVPIQ